MVSSYSATEKIAVSFRLHCHLFNLNFPAVQLPVICKDRGVDRVSTFSIEITSTPWPIIPVLSICAYNF